MKSILNDADRKEVLGRVARVRPDSARQWGRMSPHGMVCHLADAFASVLGDREAKDHSTLLGRTAMKWFALSTPVPWPKGVPTLPEADQERGGTKPVDFDADLARLLALAEAFPSRLDATSMRHPLFGRMSRGEWGRWAYRHVDHHARQFGL